MVDDSGGVRSGEELCLLQKLVGGYWGCESSFHYELSIDNYIH